MRNVVFVSREGCDSAGEVSTDRLPEERPAHHDPHTHSASSKPTGSH